MPNDYQKLPIQQSLNAMATNRALAAIERTGRALPCSVVEVNPDGIGYSFVKVKFEVQGGPWTLPPLILPKAESQWLRAPTQVGDFGMTVPADTYTGGISGFGGVADLTVDYGNMSTLVWVPVASSDFGAAPNPDQAYLNGPAGVFISDTAQTITFIVDKATGTIQMAGSGTTSTDAIVRLSDLQVALDTLVITLQAWAAAHFQSGASTPPAPIAPTATGSDKSFTA